MTVAVLCVTGVVLGAFLPAYGRWVYRVSRNAEPRVLQR